VAQDGWTFSGRTGSCAACQKQFVVGDALFSALYQEQGEFIRKDYCESCWPASRSGDQFSFWRSVVPEPEEVEKKKRRLDAMLNPETLLEVLKEMPDDPDPAKRRFRFVLSLMVMRRKKLKLLQIARRKAASGEGTEDFLIMQTTGRAKKQRFEIADVKMTEDEMIAAQDEVGRLLALGGVEDALAGVTQKTEDDANAAATDAAAEGAAQPGGAADGVPDDGATVGDSGDGPGTEGAEAGADGAERAGTSHADDVVEPQAESDGGSEAAAPDTGGDAGAVEADGAEAGPEAAGDVDEAAVAGGAPDPAGQD